MSNQSDETKFAIIQRDISYILQDVAEIKQNQSSKFVTNDQFEPIKKIVYGLVGLILVAVVGAIMGVIMVRV